MATKNASGNQGQVKDPEHDGRLKGHKGGEAPKAHAEGTHPDEKDAKHDAKQDDKHAAPKKAAAKKHEDEAAHDEPAHDEKHAPKKAAAKSHKEPAHPEAKDEPKSEPKEEPKAEAKKAEPAKAEPAKAEAKGTEADDASEDADLKSREYTDAQGNVHHHTKKYMESHKGE